MAVAASLKLRLELDGVLPPILADPQLVQQVMLNLLSNAIKFTPAGGAVTVRSSATDEFTWIEVSDTGIGIPADQLPHLGQPFRQASDTTRRSNEGSGLGLALAKSFCELQGGKLSIRSTVGVGTTVRVELPVAKGAAGA